jgi:poly(3-hydroxybutyrate) depolymerase
MKIPSRASRLRSCVLFALLASPVAAGAQATDAPAAPASIDADPFPVGSGVIEADFDGTPLNLHYYKPANYTGARFILLFHGASRTASGYRDNSSGMGALAEALVVVPEFDLERFPSRLYQFGGVFREDGSVADAEERTYAYVPKLVDYIRGREGDANMPYLLVGFSAGAQFVDRMSAFLDTDAERVIAMSAGSCLFPTRDLTFGLGFGGLPQELSDDGRIRRYLAQPLTIYVGTNDTDTPQLPGGEAYRQGVHRYSRNIRCFNEAMDLAHEQEWDFNWRLVIADGPGHSPPDMFNHGQTPNALFGHRSPGN